VSQEGKREKKNKGKEGKKEGAGNHTTSLRKNHQSPELRIPLCRAKGGEGKERGKKTERRRKGGVLIYLRAKASDSHCRWVTQYVIKRGGEGGKKKKKKEGGKIMEITEGVCGSGKCLISEEKKEEKGEKRKKKRRGCHFLGGSQVVEQELEEEEGKERKKKRKETCSLI